MRVAQSPNLCDRLDLQQQLDKPVSVLLPLFPLLTPRSVIEMNAKSVWIPTSPGGSRLLFSHAPPLRIVHVMLLCEYTLHTEILIA